MSNVNRLSIVVLILSLLATAPAARAQISVLAAFPTADETDTRMLSFGCVGTDTFEQDVSISIGVPGDTASFEIMIFDGDTSGPSGNWDLRAGSPAGRELVFELYFDPEKEASTDDLVARWFGNSANPLVSPSADPNKQWTTAQATMPNNDWWTVTVDTPPDPLDDPAAAPSGNRFYHMLIKKNSPCIAGEELVSNLKFATSTPETFIISQFGFEAAFRAGPNDRNIIYPDNPAPGPIPPPGATTTYDGTYDFFINVPQNAVDLEIFNGDFDHGIDVAQAGGSFPGAQGVPSGVDLTDPTVVGGLCADTDDANTPNDYSDFPPELVLGGAVPEGANAPGDPPDDNKLDIARRGWLENQAPANPNPTNAGCVRYSVFDPNGVEYSNNNPSGNLEWQRFRIATINAADPNTADYGPAVAQDGVTFVTTDVLPAGVWRISIEGLDLANLNFWFIEGGACALVDGEPSCPPAIYLLGDTVFFDPDADGIQEAGEFGIPGVIVNLFLDPNEPPIATRITGDASAPQWEDCVANNTGLPGDTDGLYCFGVDDPDTYTVRIAPENFLPGGALFDLDSTTGGEEQTDVLAGCGESCGPEDNVLTYDFGYVGGFLGDRVWFDQDGDGVQDAGEPGIEGVTLRLLDSGGSLIATTTTAGDGLYLFPGLVAGDYTVEVDETTLPAGLDVRTFDLDGGLDGTADASLVFDPDRGLVYSRRDVDFGYRGIASVGDRVWNDADGDGVQDAGEPGINGVVVELLDSDGNVIATQITSGDGGYFFGNLPPGDYTVRVVPPAGFFQTFDFEGPLDDQASVTLGLGEQNLDVDFGYRSVLVGDTVFIDNDADGVIPPEAGEPGVQGVIVNLLDAGGNPVDSTVTGAGGLYFFDVVPGTYTVQVDGANFTGGSLRGAAGDRVWFDGDDDGVDSGDPQVDPGLANVEVQLFDDGGDGPGGGNDVLLATTLTDLAGNYIFAGLPAGSYYTTVNAATVPAGLVFSVGTDPSAVHTVVTDEVDLTLDFGYRNADPGTAVIGDFVWSDTDGDKVQDPGESGIGGVTLELRLDGTTTVVATATTAPDGSYLFTGVAAGEYRVHVTDASGVLAGYSLTTGNDPTDKITVAAGDVFLEADFGYRRNALFDISDRVWFDADRSGTLNGAEAGIDGVTVSLVTAGGVVIADTVTSGGGFFTFPDLPDGTYFLEITDVGLALDGLLPTTQPSVDGELLVSLAGADVSAVSFGWVDTGALAGLAGTVLKDPVGDVNAQIDDVDVFDVLTYDFGYITAGSIGDRVWFDLDGDTTDNGGSEPGIGGVQVILELQIGADPPILIATTTTDGAGFYTFGGLRPTGAGELYVVTVVPPAGLVQTYDLVGPLDDAAAVPLGLGENRIDVDFGYRTVDPACDGLAVEKLCQVIPDPEPFVCSDAKPLDVLGMTWEGTGTVRVKAWKGAVGSTLLDDVSGIAPGAEVAITGYAGSPNDVFWEVFDDDPASPTYQQKLGESKFHLSCSDDAMNDENDCGLPQGNGKSDDAGFINDWALDQLAGSGLTLDCSPEPPAPAEACEFVGREVSCDTVSSPDNITWRYTGGGCAATDNQQEPGKHVCTETDPGIEGGDPVTITDKDGNVFALLPGEEFTTTRSASGELTLTQGGAEEFNLIHVSCSQPLVALDVYGSLTLVGLDGVRADEEVIYTYTVTGPPGAGPLTVVDDHLGVVGGPVNLPASGVETFEVSAPIAETTVNRADVFVDGLVCAIDFATVTVTEPCDVCAGGTTDVSFEFQGTDSLDDVVIYDKNDPDPSKILFGPATVAPGDPVPITKRPGQSKLASDISIWVGGVLYAKIHTSCSQPIGEGLFIGDFLIVEARSKDNGLICPLDVCDVTGAAGLEFSGQEARWDLTNLGALDTAIRRITVTWPAAAGDLIEVKRDGDTIHKGDFSPTSAVIDSGWEGDLGKRRIKAGETDTLKLKFAADAVTDPSAYQITVEFDLGCAATFVPPEPPPPGCDSWDCSKPIDALFMVWDGTQAVRVKAWKGPVGSALLADVDGVAVGQEVQIFGFAGSPNDVTWEIFAAGTSTKLGESKFHLSCSDDEMNGIEDLGNRQGNGKSNDAGLINDWIFVGIVDSDETLDCNPDPGSPVGGSCIRVGSGLDDVEERVSDGDMYIDSSDLELVDDTRYRGLQTVGIRFQNVSVPQGAAITSAFLEFETDETNGGAAALTFRAEAADDAAAFAGVAFDVSSRATTAASVAWAPPEWLTESEKHQTPDLSPVVEEVVGRPGWASGNSMVFVVTGSGKRSAESFEGEPENAPLLCVSFGPAQEAECPCVDSANWANSDAGLLWEDFTAGIFSSDDTVCSDADPLTALTEDILDTSLRITSVDADLLQCRAFSDDPDFGFDETLGVTAAEAAACRLALRDGAAAGTPPVACP